MTRAGLGGAAVLMAARLAVVLAQVPDFTGTWKLDTTRSRSSEAAGLVGLSGVGAPATLHITQAANGTLVIESQVNESHSRVYQPGGKSSTPVFVGQPGTITMTSRWDGRTLVSEGSQEAPSNASGVKVVREVLALSADGGTLTIDVSATLSGDRSESRFVYARTRDVGPCQSWPTPCKY